MAGTIKLDGTTFLSKSGSTFTQTNTTLGADVVIPASIGGTVAYISKGTASNSASLEFSNLNTLTQYKNLLFIFNQVLPVSDNPYLLATVAISGTTYKTAKYLHIAWQVNSNGSSHGSGTISNTTSELMKIGEVGNTQTVDNIGESDFGIIGNMLLMNHAETKKFHTAIGDFGYGAGNGYIYRTMQIGKYFEVDSPLTAIKFAFNSGNISSGSIAMYGVKDA